MTAMVLWFWSWAIVCLRGRYREWPGKRVAAARDHASSCEGLHLIRVLVPVPTQTLIQVPVQVPALVLVPVQVLVLVLIRMVL